MPRPAKSSGLEARASEIDSKTWHGFLHPDDRLEAERQHLAAIDDDKVVKLPYRIIRKDGEVRHVETLAKAVRSQGASGYLVGTIRDITDEIRAARAPARREGALPGHARGDQ